MEKLLADIQKEIKKDSTILQDSMKLKARIQKIETVNPKTQHYFKRKYLQRK